MPSLPASPLSRLPFVALLALAATAAAVWWWGPGAAEPPPAAARERVIVEEFTAAIATGERAAPAPQPVEREAVASRTVEVAMQRPDTIAGIVADEDGVPIDGAVVWITGHDGEVRTDAAGCFAFARAAADTGTVAIRGVTDKDGHRGDHEELVATRWVPWGTHDLAFVLRRKVDVQVDLVDAAGNPVVAGVTFGSYEYMNRGESSFAFRVSRGSYTLRCSDLSDRTLAAPPPRQVDVNEACRVAVVIGPRVERTVVVIGKDGSPVAGSSVELDPSRAVSGRASARVGPWTEYAVAAVARDEQGRIVLRGAGLVPHTVRVTGRDHAPVIVDGVRLDVPEPLTIRLGHDACLRVHMSPPGAVDRMRELQSSWIGLHGSRERGVRAGHLFDPTTLEFFVAPGSWEVAILDGPFAGVLTDVNLAAGDTTSIDVHVPGLDVAYVAPAVVCEQANAYAQAYVFLAREPRPGDAANPAVALGVPARRNETCIVPAGRYRARLPRIAQSLSDEVVDVPPDGTVDARFRVRLGSVVIRLIDGSGEPRRDVRIGLARDGVLSVEDELARWTDGDGLVRAQCGVGVLQVVALPERPYRLGTSGHPASMPKLRANVEPRTFVGVITVREGAVTEATFVLP